ncbi:MULTISPECIES: glycerol-3-phosphate 1-O-acyltransferase PlsY [Salimicrobium]|uniref:Glycerol-3-phosphate acyltransferase n=2 Tax=Salimicrobium TaxID=351195 RepID=A0ABY1KQJ1_9BACI|nr:MULTISPECIES: glycerol-3-phosphate 1-O-acyltransferase PlsY [Salimicrobium]SDX28403.1 glycerol-3-phosphate acyltransferase PlsY [Salimicrobium album]SIS65440.1 acyl-phosphate glycerol-3-phosphate acyltransferase [Salimicrobium salexigens]
MEFIKFAAIAYLLGSIPTGLLVGKLFYNVDIREHGSGNLGGTNAFRVLGVKPGLSVTVADILKGTVAAALPLWMGTELNGVIIGIFAVIGHMYPVFARFKGGKAVATSGGIILGVNPLLFGIMLLTFFVTLYISKYVSLSSMVTGVVTVAVTIIQQEFLLTAVVSVLTAFVIYRHRTNIIRIKNREEPKITWM